MRAHIILRPYIPMRVFVLLRAQVGGKDEVGAKMDSMELERERGITIASAATHTQWGDNPINIIDTPGHVDFTIEVERALRVLDGAILLVCGSSGVQSQTLTVDKQMKRYSVPRICFVNKLDRLGADAFSVVEQVRKNLGLNAALCQIPIGLEKEHRGVIDLFERKALYFDGDNGETVRYEDEIPAHLVDSMEETRMRLIERLADADEEIGELYLMEEEPTLEQLHAAIRRQTIACTFVPVFCGSAYKNKGVQPLLDAVVRYLPAPDEMENIALDQKQVRDCVCVCVCVCGFCAREYVVCIRVYMHVYVYVCVCRRRRRSCSLTSLMRR
jgi:elongation factor G